MYYKGAMKITNRVTAGVCQIIENGFNNFQLIAKIGIRPMHLAAAIVQKGI